MAADREQLALKMPLSAGLSSLQGQRDGLSAADGRFSHGYCPMIAMFIVLQNQFVEGIA